jgi:hypothetical protein
LKNISKSKDKTGYFVILLPFLLSFYLVFRLFAANPNEVGTKELLILLLIFQLAGLIVYMICFLLVRDWVKSSLIATTLLFFHATYGIDLYLLWGIGIPFLNRLILFILTILIAAALIYKIIKSNNLIGAVTFTKVFVIILIIFSCFNLIRNVKSSDEKQQVKSTVSKVGSFNSDFAGEFQRDVYYMLFDMYMGHRQLKQYYNFDNSEFVEALRSRGFYVVENGRSNYSTTYVSMPATFNMEYMPRSPMYRWELMNMLWNNKVFALFSGWGFKTNMLNLGSYFPTIAKADHQYKTIFTQFTEETIMQTFSGELIKRLLYQKLGAKRTPKSFSILYEIANDDAYTFTYSHMLIPHPPYYFTPEGELYKNVDLDWQSKTDDDRFIDQYKYLNKKIIEFVDYLLASETPPVIFLQGDHGKAAETNEPAPLRDVYDQELSILNAIYFPDGDYSLLNENITSINTFIVFQKKYIDPSIELKEDLSYKINLVDRYDYYIVDVSEYGFNYLNCEEDTLKTHNQ